MASDFCREQFRREQAKIERRLGKRKGNWRPHDSFPSAEVRINRRWWGTKIQKEVTVTRVSMRQVSYIATDKSVLGTVSEWQFLKDFQPVTECKKKVR